MEIKNTTCAVTGAGRGLGRFIALELMAKGAVVHACDINKDDLQRLTEETNGKIACYQCDVSDETQVTEMFEKIDKTGGVSVLINNAGIIRDGLLLKVSGDKISSMPFKDFQTVININLGGVFLCARAAAAQMSRRGAGVIVNISSVARAGNFGQTNYSASKAGVDAMTVTWSKELARYGIRCAAVAPGYIETEMTSSIKPDVLEKITGMVPRKRLGTMAEIADAVDFIIRNDYVNGKIIEVDGGLRI